MRRLLSLVLSFTLIVNQSGFAQGVANLGLSRFMGARSTSAALDHFRPLHLRYLSYDNVKDGFELYLDKGDRGDHPSLGFQDETQKVFNYFLIGLALPNESFWVNLRPDSPERIIDDALARTDMGKVMLAADVQLKKDLALATSPSTPQGKAYWDKLYQKAGELFGSEQISITSYTRPWIVPGEVILRETKDDGRGTNYTPTTNLGAYVYKASLKVMLEEDYFNVGAGSKPALQARAGLEPAPTMGAQTDPRYQALNAYSSELIRHTIIPQLTKEVNTARRYAGLRQVYYSLILAQWFKKSGVNHSSAININKLQQTAINSYIKLTDSRNLNGLTSKTPWSKMDYFEDYRKSFQEGEYNVKKIVRSGPGPTVRTYVSGGGYFAEAYIPSPPSSVSSSAVIKILDNSADFFEVTFDNRNVALIQKTYAASSSLDDQKLPDLPSSIIDTGHTLFIRDSGLSSPVDLPKALETASSLLASITVMAKALSQLSDKYNTKFDFRTGERGSRELGVYVPDTAYISLDAEEFSNLSPDLKALLKAQAEFAPVSVSPQDPPELIGDKLTQSLAFPIKDTLKSLFPNVMGLAQKLRDLSIKNGKLTLEGPKPVYSYGAGLHGGNIGFMSIVAHEIKDGADKKLIDLLNSQETFAPISISPEVPVDTIFTQLLQILLPGNKDLLDQIYSTSAYLERLKLNLNRLRNQPQSRNDPEISGIRTRLAAIADTFDLSRAGEKEPILILENKLISLSIREGVEIRYDGTVAFRVSLYIPMIDEIQQSIELFKSPYEETLRFFLTKKTGYFGITKGFQRTRFRLSYNTFTKEMFIAANSNRSVRFFLSPEKAAQIEFTVKDNGGVDIVSPDIIFAELDLQSKDNSFPFGKLSQMPNDEAYGFCRVIPESKFQKEQTINANLENETSLNIDEQPDIASSTINDTETKAKAMFINSCLLNADLDIARIVKFNLPQDFYESSLGGYIKTRDHLGQIVAIKKDYLYVKVVIKDANGYLFIKFDLNKMCNYLGIDPKNLDYQELIKNAGQFHLYKFSAGTDLTSFPLFLLWQLALLTDNVRYKNLIKQAAINTGSSSGVVIPQISAMTDQSHKTMGGVDLRYINLVQQVSSSLELPPQEVLLKINLVRERDQLERILEAHMLPAGERVLQYVAACYVFGSEEDAAGMLVRFYRQAETCCASSDERLNKLAMKI